jgi:hypothetical protein
MHFVDENVGEFMYQIDGRTLAPQSSDFMWTCKSGTALEKPIRITPFNPLREKALYAVHQGRVPTKTGKKGDRNSTLDRDSFQLPKKSTYKVKYILASSILLLTADCRCTTYPHTSKDHLKLLSNPTWIT